VGELVNWSTGLDYIMKPRSPDDKKKRVFLISYSSRYFVKVLC
jgi:hypothetical protein